MPSSVSSPSNCADRRPTGPTASLPGGRRFKVALTPESRRPPAKRCSLVLALALAAAGCAGFDSHTPGVPPHQRLPLHAQGKSPPPWMQQAGRGVVSVSHPAAARAGADVLAHGGNAVDAAAAIQFALNVVEPQSSGLGGGGFMLVYLAATGKVFALDSREAAPAAASPTMFRLSGVTPAERFDIASSSGVSVGVPGTLHGIATALQLWGSWSLADTLAPAIRLAEQGFRVNAFLAADLADDGGRTAFQPEVAAVFRPGGSRPAEGDLLRQPDLARTFRLIAADGTDVFYQGEIAAAIVDAQRRSRSPIASEGAGRMTLQDLAVYRSKLREPVRGEYRGWQVASMGPPSSGGLALLQILKELERFPLGEYGFGSAEALHPMIEAMRLTFADRAVWMGDDDVVPVPQKGLLNPTYLASRSALIQPQARVLVALPGDPLPYQDVALRRGSRELAVAPSEPEKGVNTTHYAVVDRWGNVVTATSTIETRWGSGIMVPGYGFLLNNELTDFNLVPSRDAATGNPGTNDVAPYKRPRSSMAPTLLLKNGKPFAAYGSPGGATIINSVLNTTLNLIDHGMTIQQAIDAPRLSVTSPAGAVTCEAGQDFMRPGFAPSTLAHLQALGHYADGSSSFECDSSFGSVQGVIIDLRTGQQYGGADRRREGTVISLPR